MRVGVFLSVGTAKTVTVVGQFVGHGLNNDAYGNVLMLQERVDPNFGGVRISPPLPFGGNRAQTITRHSAPRDCYPIKSRNVAKIILPDRFELRFQPRLTARGG